MTTATGTAIDFHDLLDQLRVFATGTAGWTQLEHTPAVVRDGGIPDPANDFVRLASPQTLTLRGPGTGAGREVYISIITESDTVQQQYSLQLFGHIAYNGSLPISGQSGVSPLGPRLNLSGGTMRYWFYVNDRRIIVIAQIGTTYVSMYAGFLVANALPAEYPHPLYVAGNYLENQSPSVSNSRNRFIADPGDGSALYRDLDGGWVSIANHIQDTTQELGLGQQSRGVVWPFTPSARISDDTNNLNSPSWAANGLRNLRPNALGEIIRLQTQVVDGRTNVDRVVGLLDGVEVIPGFGRTAEETIGTGIVFTNIFRSTERDFMLIQDTA